MKRPSEWLKQLTRDRLNLRSMVPVLNQARMMADSKLWSRVRKLMVDVTIALETPWEGPVGSDPIRQHGVQAQVLAITPYVQRQYT